MGPFSPVSHEMEIIIIMYIVDYLCSEKQPDVKHHQLPRTKPLPSMESLGPAPAKPPRPPAVNLQAFRRQRAVSKTCREGEEMPGAPPTARGRHGFSAGIPQSPPCPPSSR